LQHATASLFSRGMKIVVLDGYTLNPGDLSWSAFEALGACEIFERSAPNEIVSRLKGAQAALTNKITIGRPTMESLPDLKYIGVTATGFNIVDVQAAKERGLTVTNVPAYGTDSVAQATFALLLELTNRVGHHAQTVREERWNRSPDFSYWDFPLVELAGLNLGIIGYGRIGQAVARIGRAFGMNVLATASRSGSNDPGVRVAALDELLRESDVVSLHCPLTPETKGLMNTARLGLMKRSAFLLNTSRGPLIVEEDLAAALHAGQIAGAGLDVLAVEPPVQGSPLFAAPNCFITPHQAWATRAARERLMNISAANLAAWLKGVPQNVVS
jgi:glycerate dehydrogenase